VEDERANARTGHTPSYAEAKKIKWLALHTHGCHSGTALHLFICIRFHSDT